jgi:hypothetical protein
MSEPISEHISSPESQQKSLEIQRLLSDVTRYAHATSVKLEKEWITIPQDQLQKLVYPSVMSIMRNPDIIREPRAMEALSRHIADFYDRIGRLHMGMLRWYMKQKWVFEDISYDKWKGMRYMTNDQKNAIVLQELLDRNIEYGLKPQLAMLDRAFQPRALQYDYTNWASYQTFLWKVDMYLPKWRSILDHVLERWDGGKVNIAKDQQMSTVGMEYIIDSLNPPGALWLKQMAKNGNIGAGTRVKWYTDAIVNGKTIDVVQLLIAFRNNTRVFQSEERELSDIRQIVLDPKKKNEYIPTVSQNFPTITPGFIEHEQGTLTQILETIALINQWKWSKDECLRLLWNNVTSFLWVNEQLISGIYSGVSIDGRILKPGERTRDAVIGAAKFATAVLMWEVALMKVIAKIPFKKLWVNGKAFIGWLMAAGLTTDSQKLLDAVKN